MRISTGKIITLITNDLDAKPEDIADLYKQRWQIELFFKWVKQNLKIKHFLGTSEIAVRIQLFTALIAFLVLRAAYACQRAITQPLTFVLLVALNLMHKRSIDSLIQADSRRQSIHRIARPAAPSRMSGVDPIKWVATYFLWYNLRQASGIVTLWAGEKSSV